MQKAGVPDMNRYRKHVVDIAHGINHYAIIYRVVTVNRDGFLFVPSVKKFYFNNSTYLPNAIGKWYH